MAASTSSADSGMPPAVSSSAGMAVHPPASAWAPPAAAPPVATAVPAAPAAAAAAPLSPEEAERLRRGLAEMQQMVAALCEEKAALMALVQQQAEGSEADGVVAQLTATVSALSEQLDDVRAEHLRVVGEAAALKTELQRQSQAHAAAAAAAREEYSRLQAQLEKAESRISAMRSKEKVARGAGEKVEAAKRLRDTASIAISSSDRPAWSSAVGTSHRFAMRKEPGLLVIPPCVRALETPPLLEIDLKAAMLEVESG